MAKKNTVVRLKDTDWEELFPGTSFIIGGTEIFLTPLSLKSIATITGKLAGIANTFSNLETTIQDIDNRSVEAVTGIVQVIVTEAPDILSEMSGLHPEDVQGLPLEVAVNLFNACLDVNLESQESLIKNFKSLGDKFSKFLSPAEEPAELSAKDRNDRARILEN